MLYSTVVVGGGGGVVMLVPSDLKKAVERQVSIQRNLSTLSDVYIEYKYTVCLLYFSHFNKKLDLYGIISQYWIKFCNHFVTQ